MGGPFTTWADGDGAGLGGFGWVGVVVLAAIVACAYWDTVRRRPRR